MRQSAADPSPPQNPSVLTWLEHEGSTEGVLGAMRCQLSQGLVQHTLAHLQPAAGGNGAVVREVQQPHAKNEPRCTRAALLRNKFTADAAAGTVTQPCGGSPHGFGAGVALLQEEPAADVAAIARQLGPGDRDRRAAAQLHPAAFGHHRGRPADLGRRQGLVQQLACEGAGTQGVGGATMQRLVHGARAETALSKGLAAHRRRPHIDRRQGSRCSGRRRGCSTGWRGGSSATWFRMTDSWRLG